MRRDRDTWRLFVAVYPRSEAAAECLSLLDGLTLPSHRITPAHQLHLTAHFIGDTRASELTTVCESVRRSASGLAAMELQARELISLPDRPPARLLAVKFDPDPTLEELHRRLVTRLARNPRSKERFLPHMTLCRFASHGPSLSLPIPDAARPRFRVAEVSLVSSVLKPGGAEHRVLETIALD